MPNESLAVYSVSSSVCACHVGWISSSSGCLSITFASKHPIYCLSLSQCCSLSCNFPTNCSSYRGGEGRGGEGRGKGGEGEGRGGEGTKLTW